jgi:23S rRNA (adenine2030-N6)-methyltransferase
VALLALLRALQRKDTGFLYLDTHAGSGLHEAGSEAAGGWLRLRTCSPEAAELRDYQQLLGANRAYPGSPLLAARLLRVQDRAVCLELQPPEQRALERALDGALAEADPPPRVHTECADGWQRWRGYLPPLERRALILIDPPYEDSDDDFRTGALTVAAMLERLPAAVIALWYPIKHAADLPPWKQRLKQALVAPALCSELCVHPPDSRVALNGSGLLVVNPPYRFDQHMAVWLPELAQLLAAGTPPTSCIEWLIHERA